MYNEEQKLKYLETIESESSRKYAITMFNRFEKCEQDVFGDIASWDEDQTYDAINLVHILDFSTIKQYLSYIEAYKEFTGGNNVSLNAQEINLTNAIRDVIIPNTEDLNIELRKTSNPMHGNYFCAAVCFAWLGVNIQVMPNIKSDAVLFSSNMIIDNECNIHMSDIDNLVINILEEYWNVAEAIRGNGKAYPLNNGRFIRLMVGANSRKIPKPINVASIYTTFTTFKEKYEAMYNKPFKLFYGDVLKSGGLYRLYQAERQGVDWSTNSSDASLLSIYAAPGKTFDIRSLYRQYKRAFNLD